MSESLRNSWISSVFPSIVPLSPLRCLVRPAAVRTLGTERVGVRLTYGSGTGPRVRGPCSRSGSALSTSLTPGLPLPSHVPVLPSRPWSLVPRVVRSLGVVFDVREDDTPPSYLSATTRTEVVPFEFLDLGVGSALRVYAVVNDFPVKGWIQLMTPLDPSRN